MYANIKYLFSYLDLFLILTQRNIKVRYRQTLLGFLWIIIQPLLSSSIFAVIFGKFASLPSENTPYVLFAFSGIIPWFFFSHCLQRATFCIANDEKLITKVYFPRILIPLSSCAVSLIDFIVTVGIFLFLSLFYETTFSYKILMIFPLAFVLLLFSISFSLWFSALYVYYRDLLFVVPFMLQIWMYISPIAYSKTIVPEKFLSLYALNPLVGITDSFRWAFFNYPVFPLKSFSISLLWTLIVLFSGIYIFHKLEKNFADII